MWDDEVCCGVGRAVTSMRLPSQGFVVSSFRHRLPAAPGSRRESLTMAREGQLCGFATRLSMLTTTKIGKMGRVWSR